MRLLSRLAIACFAAVLVGGCSPSQADVERAVREEMSARLEGEVSAVSLAKQPGGGYAGSATAASGDVYDVVVDPPRGARLQWRLVPAQGTAERIVRTGLEKQHKVPVRSLALAKQADGSYDGTAVLEDGTRLHVRAKMTRKEFTWEAVPLLG